MIRFINNKDGYQEKNRGDRSKGDLFETIILSTVAFSLSATVGVEFQDRVNEMFMEIDCSHKDKLKSKEEKQKQKEAASQAT